MIAEILMGGGFAFFGIRLIKDRTVGLRWIAVDAISALLVGVSGYFYLFPGVSTTITNGVVTQAIPTAISGNGFLMLVSFIGVYVLIMILWMLRDFVEARKGLPAIKEDE